MSRPRLSVVNFTVRSASCPICYGRGVTEYGIRYMRLPVRAGSPHLLAAVYRCDDCGWAAEAGQKPERPISGNGQRWPLEVPSELRRFARRGRLREQSDLLASGKVLTWYPSGGIWLTDDRDSLLVSIKPKDKGGRLVWQRRSLDPKDDGGRKFSVEYRSAGEAAQASMTKNLMRGLTQKGPPEFTLFGERQCGRRDMERLVR